MKPTGTKKGADKNRRKPSPKMSARRSGKQTEGLELELARANEDLSATRAVLSIISQSPKDAQPVFDAIAENAARLCGAIFSTVQLLEGSILRTVATTTSIGPEAAAKLREITKPTRQTGGGQAIVDRTIVHIADAIADPDYSSALARAGGWRGVLAVPIMRDGAPIGAIAVAKPERGLFTDRQVQLLATFADQAGIAILNARLFDEVNTRTMEVTDALRRQTATSQVLRAISTSAGRLEPVYDSVLKNAIGICGAEFGVLFGYKDGLLHAAATMNAPPAYRDFLTASPWKLGKGTATGRAISERVPVQIADLETVNTADDEGIRNASTRLGQIRTIFSVPILHENKVYGAITIYRQEVREFTEKEIDLVSSFADQVAIAIENARLLTELRETLNQQTATAEILSAISNSLNDTRPVFHAIVKSGIKLFPPGVVVVIAMPQDDKLDMAAVAVPDDQDEESWRRRFPLPLTKEYVHCVAFLEQKTLDIPDAERVPKQLSVGARNFLKTGFKAITIVPLMRGDKAIGAISVSRPQPGPLSEKHHSILKTFASQAVIAIENTRLLKELRESLERQTATAEVLKTISRSAFDLPTVLETLVGAAARLCQADQGTIAREQDGEFRRVASYGFSREFNELIRTMPVSREAGSAGGRALYEKRIVHIGDVREDPHYTFEEAKRLGGFQTILAVPMLRDDVAIGVLVLTRKKARPFSEKEIELVTTFADQAAIAIENVRLYENAEARSRELAKSLEELRTAQDRLVQTEKLASLGQLTAGIAHEIKNPLNFVNNFSAISTDLIGELQQVLQTVAMDDELRGEIAELSGMLKGNLDRIEQHGKRADSIVKNMLMHARRGSGDRRSVDINALVEESLNLAYHGARAERQGFNVTLEKSLDPAAGEAELFPQEISRVLLNIITNGFYATIMKSAASTQNRYEPRVSVVTRNLDRQVEIRIRDNGTGISPDVRKQLFSPFFTTKPVGEGTGLGLSISHDIIVKQHSGAITVKSEPGEFTEFRIVLPRTAVH